MTARSLIMRPWQLHAIQAERLKRVLVPITLREFGPSDTPGYDWTLQDRRMRWHDVSTEVLLHEFCPYVPGSTLVVREGWAQLDWGPFTEHWWFHEGEPAEGRFTVYQADVLEERYMIGKKKWRGAGRMPLWAARYVITIGDVRPVRVREVGEDEAIATGVVPYVIGHGPVEHWEYWGEGGYRNGRGYRDGFEDQWTQDHGRKHPWDTAHAWSIEVTGVEVRV
jgi:hypothetical protein